MLDRSFIEKIEQMAKNEIVAVNEVEYSTRDLYKVKKPMASSLQVYTLESVVNFIKASMKLGAKITYPLFVKMNYDKVQVYSQLSENLDRDYLIEAHPLCPNIPFGRFMNVDEFIIKLQTNFEDTPNRIALLKLVSQLMSVDTLELSDNGFSQEVVIKAGVALDEKVEIQPIIKLKPIRTFMEVDQVESLFLFRVNNQKQVALFEADGGKWKEDARQLIKAYFEEQILADVILI